MTVAKAEVTKQSMIAQAQKYQKRIVDYETYNHYAILSAQAKNSLVSKSKETTRSHPEHGRKDLLQ